MYMGGELGHITLLPIRAEGEGTDAASSSTAFVSTFGAFAAFDANAAKCFKPEEKEALLGVIESGTGSIEAFNTTVRDIFASMSEASCTGPASAPGAAEEMEKRSTGSSRTSIRKGAPISRGKSSHIEVLAAV